MIAHSFIFFFSFYILANSDYTLVWYEEFEGPNLDTTKWDYEINCWGGGNNEKQCYVKNDNNCKIQNGKLVLHPVYWPNGYTGSILDCTNNFENSCNWTQPVTSARIRTLHSQSWKYGRFEFRAKLPIGNFLWPAIWMLPTWNIYGLWAASGEIDIVEFRGQPSQYNILEQNLHHGGVWPFNTYTGSGPVAYPQKNFTDDFHVFALEWTPNSMAWYVDDDQGFELSLNRSFYSGSGPDPYTGPFQPFDQEFYIIMNLAIAGSFFNEEQFGKFYPPNDTQTWLTDFQIDYVRVFQDTSGDNIEVDRPPTWPFWPYVIIGILGIIVIVQSYFLNKKYPKRPSYVPV